MGEIHLFKSAKDLDRQTAIEILDELKKRVESGEIVAVGVAYVTHDGDIGAGFSETAEGGSLLGSVTLLQSRVINALEGDYDEE